MTVMMRSCPCSCRGGYGDSNDALVPVLVQGGYGDSWGAGVGAGAGGLR